MPPAWPGLLERVVVLARDLDSADRKRLLHRAATFATGRRWEGIGMEIDDSVRLVVAAHACLLTMALEGDPYRSIGSVVVYPTTVVRRGKRNLGGGVASDGPMAIHGETRAGGPMVIVWRAAQVASLHPERGRNVVLHEFAHQLDLYDGVADGMPPLGSRDEELAWQDTMDAVYARLVAELDPMLGRYATTNLGELFAVATERFFTRPADLLDLHPDLYALLRSFYRQDPALRRPG